LLLGRRVLNISTVGIAIYIALQDWTLGCVEIDDCVVLLISILDSLLT
jgi:hypothetical protein